MSKSTLKGTLVIATNNPDKLKEIKDILKNNDLKLLSPAELDNFPKIEENGKTLKENAIIKAKAVWNKYHLPCLADDTGLEVDCLGGKPGVYSSRYAGANATYEDNRQKLLREMENIPQPDRTARFRCVMAFIDNNGIEHITEGTIEGEIIDSCRGDSGFGYDPVFLVPSLVKTLAELSVDEKNKISHRHNALKKIIPVIKEKLMRNK